MPDLVCMRDLDLWGRETTDELEILDQDLFHRLIELYGSNPDDEDRGVGVTSALSGIITDRDIAGEIRTDFAKDDRVTSTAVTITPIPETTGGFDIRIRVRVGEDILPIDARLVDGTLKRVVV